jgi:hypothetical protein
MRAVASRTIAIETIIMRRMRELSGSSNCVAFVRETLADIICQ